jgi:tyrosyl-tRNA synthetase
MNLDEQLATLRRGTTEIISEEDLLRKLSSGRPLRVKLGVDPTVAHVTLGWAVVLRKLRDFQRLGHTACLVIGDFTAMIGDPSGKSKTRPQLSREEVQANVKEVEKQLYKVLIPDRTEVSYNADWLGKMTFEDVVRLGSHVTVSRILERDDFEKRLNEQRPISFHELLYPLCQAQDSIALKADVELGGTDQKFNNLLGRHLQPHFGQEGQVVMLCPLLVGTDGKEKMSQSLGNFVGITEEPNEMFGKTMSIPDKIMENWFELCTDVPLDEVASLMASCRSGETNPRDVKRRLAREIVTLYHSPEAAEEADRYFVETFSKRDQRVEAPSVSIPADLIQNGEVSLAHLIAALELAKSVSAARDLLKQGAVSLDGEKLADPFGKAPSEALRGRVLKAGKHQFRKLV